MLRSSTNLSKKLDNQINRMYAFEIRKDASVTTSGISVHPLVDMIYISTNIINNTLNSIIKINLTRNINDVDYPEWHDSNDILWLVKNVSFINKIKNANGSPYIAFAKFQVNDTSTAYTRTLITDGTSIGVTCTGRFELPTNINGNYNSIISNDFVVIDDIEQKKT